MIPLAYDEIAYGGGAEYAIFPLSSAQERLWLLYEIDPTDPAYHMCGAYRLTGRLDLPRLHHAVDQLCQRHEALRTRFRKVDDHPVQVVMPDSLLRLADRCVAETDLTRVLKIEGRTAFDLAVAAARFSCFALGADEHVLVVTIHHIVCDGGSIATLLADLVGLYEGRSLGTLPFQFADYAVWERTRLAQADMSQDVDWWRDRLAGLAPREPPTGTEDGSERFDVPSMAWDALADAAKRLDATPFVVAFAAFAVAVGRRRGLNDIVIGTPFANRPTTEAERVVGFFANTVPIRVVLSSAPTFVDLVRRLRLEIPAALNRGSVPFDRIVDAANIRRDGLRTPLIDALFTWDAGASTIELVLPGLEASYQPVDLDAPKFDLSLECNRSSGTARLEYRGFTRADARGYIADFISLLSSQDDVALPKKIESGPKPHHTSAAPSAQPSRYEPDVAWAWREVLGHDVDRDRSFFDAGGHSLLASRILTLLERHTGIRLPLRILFERPTIAGLAVAMETSTTAAGTKIPRFHSDVAPLSHGQEALWLHHRLAPMSTAYNLVGALRVSALVRQDILVAALARIVRSQAALRSRVILVEGVPMQSVRDDARFDAERIDASDRNFDEAVQEVMRHHASTPFDLAEDTLLRASIVTGAEAIALIVSTTHFCFDGSHAAFLRALDTAYANEMSGQPAVDTPARYADYAAWERSSQHDEAARAYWSSRLADPPPAVVFPTDRPRPAVRSGHGTRSDFSLAHDVASRVRAFARHRDTTISMVLFAAWVLLAARLTGQRQFAVGMPVDIRPPPMEDVIGCFVNPVVIATALPDDPSFADVVNLVRDTVHEALEHASYPFQELVEGQPDHRDLSRSPFFDAMFVSSPAPELPVFDGEKAQLIPPPASATARFDMLWAFVEHRNEQIDGFVEYATDLYDPATIERFIDLFRRVLSAAVDDPSKTLRTLPLLDATERKEILQDWNNTTADVAAPLLLHQRFERSVDREPDRIAVLFEQTQLTYGELERRANAWANFFVGRGAGPGSRIGFWDDRSLESVEILLGILKAGACFVPMASSWPARRVAWVVTTQNLRGLVTSESRAAKLAEEDATQICPVWTLERWAADHCHSQSPDRPRARTTPDDPAYLIYTSGSTGDPKGVVVRHRRIVNLVDWVNGTFAVGPLDRLLFVTSYCFDLSVYDIFGCLDAGASLRIATEADVKDPHRLVSLLLGDGITFWDSAPAMLSQLVPALSTEGGGDHSRLRLVFLSGDWVPTGLPARIAAAFPRTEVVALGGATEAVVWSNFHRVESGDRDLRSIPYGRPIRNARYYILDEGLEPCPIGVIGDLYIGGDVLADGYTDPALTAERFIPDPHDGRSGRVMYATGDRSAYRQNGTIEFFGRSDQQLKIRGHRVERGEVEAALATHKSVAACVVLARRDRFDEMQLAAWYEPRAGEGIGADDLRAHLAMRLPDYMLPARFIRVAQMPMTENGKIDLRRLASDDADDTQARERVPPQTAMERAVAEIWSETIDRSDFGIDENFFDLGGHSAAMIRIQITIEQRWNRPIRIVDLYGHPTVRLLARFLTDGPRHSEAERGLTDSSAPERRAQRRELRKRRSEAPGSTDHVRS